MDTDDPNAVLVQPISSFQEGGGLKHSHDAPYTVSTDRAAALKANGLVEYAEAQMPAPAADQASEPPAPRRRRSPRGEPP